MPCTLGFSAERLAALTSSFKKKNGRQLRGQAFDITQGRPAAEDRSRQSEYDRRHQQELLPDRCSTVRGAIARLGFVSEAKP
jgi:hypothetical protein